MRSLRYKVESTWVYGDQGRIQGFRKGGGGEQKKIEGTVHVMVPSTGPSGCDAFGVAGGWFGGGCPPPLESEKNWNKEDLRRNLVTHGSQIYWIELQFCCLLNSQVGIIQVSIVPIYITFLSIYKFYSPNIYMYKVSSLHVVISLSSIVLCIVTCDTYEKINRKIFS